MEQNSDLQRQIVSLLLPYVDTPDDRKGLLSESWGLGNPLIGEVDLTGAPREFLIRLIQESAEHGRRDEKYPIELVLESVWHRVGEDRRQAIDAILEQLRSGGVSFDPLHDRLPFEPELVQTAVGEGILFLGRRAVLAEEYAAFLDAVSPEEQAAPSFEAGWAGRVPRNRSLGKPVLGIKFADAEAYVRWLSAVTERPYRLPTVEEWKQGYQNQHIVVDVGLSEWTATSDAAGEVALRRGRPASKRMLCKLQAGADTGESQFNCFAYLARLVNPHFTFRIALELR